MPTQDTRARVDTYKEVVQETDKIRIAILGRAGIGKSTIVSRIFGISEEEAKVSHDVSGEHDINTGIAYPSNPGIIVHDSSGFQGGADKEVQVVREFLDRCQVEKHFKDQVTKDQVAKDQVPKEQVLKDEVHCIWYCIACEGERPVEGFGQEFFSNMDAITGEIPVLVIFTKYDKLVGKHRLLLSDQHQNMPSGEVRRLAEGLAAKEFEKVYLKQVMLTLRKCKKRWDWARVGRLQSPPGGVEIGDPRDETRVNGLINKTEACLEISLRPMWVRTQRHNAKRKIDASVEAGMKPFTKSAILNGIPLLPLKDLAVEMVTAHGIFTDIHKIWNPDESLFHLTRSTESNMRDAIFDKSFAQKVASQVWDIFDITGPLTQPNNTVKFMKTVAGVTLVHEWLFWYQKRLIDELSTFQVHTKKGITDAGTKKFRPLTEEEVHIVFEKFQESKQRDRMCAYIEGKLASYGLNLKIAFNKVEVEKVICNALEVAKLEVDP